MSQLRKCDICGHMIERQSGYPDQWIDLSRASVNGDRMNFGQIDICNVCKSHLAEFTEMLEDGTLTINSEYYTNLKLSTDILKFILGKEK